MNKSKKMNLKNKKIIKSIAIIFIIIIFIYMAIYLYRINNYIEITQTIDANRAKNKGNKQS